MSLQNKYLKQKGGLTSDYKGKLYNSDLKYVRKLATNERLVKIIRDVLSLELSILLNITKIYSEIHKVPLNNCLKTFFCIGNQTGSIGDPVENRIEILEYLINEGNIREILASICQFIKGEGLNNDDIKGCKIQWDVFLHPEKYSKEINIYSINNKKDKLKSLFGYDLLEIKESKLTEYGGFPDWCGTSVPILFNDTRHPVTFGDFTFRGKFAADIKPVRVATAEERNVCLLTNMVNHDEVIIQLSQKENQHLISTDRYRELRLTKPDLQPYQTWYPGRCYFSDNESWDKEMRKQYKKHNLAQVSGHTLMVLDLLSNYIPEKYLINNIITHKMLSRRFSIIILGLIIWMTPIHHSINEILMAANMSDVSFYGGSMRVYEYTFSHSIKSHINELIQIGLIPNTIKIELTRHD